MVTNCHVHAKPHSLFTTQRYLRMKTNTGNVCNVIIAMSTKTVSTKAVSTIAMSTTQPDTDCNIARYTVPTTKSSTSEQSIQQWPCYFLMKKQNLISKVLRRKISDCSLRVLFEKKGGGALDIIIKFYRGNFLKLDIILKTG